MSAVGAEKDAAFNNYDDGIPASTSRSRPPTKQTKTPTRQAPSKCKENDENGPLSSHRDPRSTPLLHRKTFTPNPKSAGRKEVTPAYAYIHPETRLLEIRGIPPSPSMVGNEDDTVVGLDADEKQCNTKLALYPIAINGGGAGLYRDPREFANGNGGGFSNNHKTAGSRRAPLKSHVRFAWPYENKNEGDAEVREDIDDMFFSSPGIPRGIAARVNGLPQFLEALKIGIVVRRHWPNRKSVFVQIFSDDGGDSIHFKFIPDDEAVIALKEQAQRYNNGRQRREKARLSVGESESRRMSRDSETTDQTNDKLDLAVPLPDYLKAKIDREEDIRKKGGFLKAVKHNILSWQSTLTIEAQDIVEVHPATHIDPFSKDGSKLGTASLRQSNTEYVKRTTFSVIVPSVQGKVSQGYSSDDLTKKWCDGEKQFGFRSLDIEMATEGEYWMLLKGFILLHRDASKGRFAAQRAGQGAGGFVSHHCPPVEITDKSAANCGTKTSCS